MSFGIVVIESSLRCMGDEQSHSLLLRTVPLRSHLVLPAKIVIESRPYLIWSAGCHFDFIFSNFTVQTSSHWKPSIRTSTNPKQFSFHWGFLLAQATQQNNRGNSDADSHLVTPSASTLCGLFHATSHVSLLQQLMVLMSLVVEFISHHQLFYCVCVWLSTTSATWVLVFTLTFGVSA